MTGLNIPEQAKVPAMPSMGLVAELDRLYLEKCEEVNKLEKKVENLRDGIKMVMEGRKKLRAELEELESRNEELNATIRVLAAEPVKGFTPAVEAPEKLPEELEELPLWSGQTVSSQDILCLSSALKNLYEIHKCDGWLLYNKLAKVLEEKIEEYCRKE